MPHIPYRSLAIVAWDNVFTRAAVTASSETTSGMAENAVDGLTYDWWEGEGDTSGDTLTVNSGSAVCDYLAIAAHDLGSAGASITLEGSPNGSAWTTVAGPYSPTDDTPWLWRFDAANYAWWRVVIQGGPCRLGVLQSGSAMVLPEGVYEGHAPSRFNRLPKILNNESDEGQLLGRTLMRTGAKDEIQQERVSPTWVREVWEPFSRHAETRPFFYAWRHALFPREVIYCWSEGPAKVDQGRGQFMSVSLAVRGQVE